MNSYAYQLTKKQLMIFILEEMISFFDGLLCWPFLSGGLLFVGLIFKELYSLFYFFVFHF